MALYALLWKPLNRTLYLHISNNNGNLFASIDFQHFFWVYNIDVKIDSLDRVSIPTKSMTTFDVIAFEAVSLYLSNFHCVELGEKSSLKEGRKI